MAIEIVGYKSGFNSPLLGEWVEVCKSELGSDGKTLKFIRIGYPNAYTFYKKYGLITKSTYDQTSGLQIIKMSVPEDFPYFIIQIRHVFRNYGPVVHAYYQLKGDIEKETYLKPPLVEAPKTEIVLFKPGQGSTDVSININFPDLSFPFVSNNEYLERIERDYEELRKICFSQALKSIYILTGSLIESIIEDSLLSNSDQAVSKYKARYTEDRLDVSEHINKWYFSRKILIAHIIGIIPNQLKMQLLDIKQHRNVVHIGYEIENEMKIDMTFVNTILSILKNLCDQLEELNKREEQN